MVDPPFELVLALQMKEGHLLKTGALLDQPRRLWVTAKTCETVFSVFSQYVALPIDGTVAWLTRNPDQAKIIDWVDLLESKHV